MRKIKIKLGKNAPYPHCFLKEDNVYSESRNIYMVDFRAFKAITNNQGKGYKIQEYLYWDHDFQNRMINHYKPTSNNPTRLMPRIAIFPKERKGQFFMKILNRKAKPQNFLVNFGNGRHRFNFLRHFGATSIPFQMSKESASNLNKLIGLPVCTMIK